MQGHTQSSAAIWTAFDNYTTAYARQLRWQLLISWKRSQSGGGVTVPGSSLIGGTDKLGGVTNVATPADYFDYFDETVNLIRFEFDRKVEEPLGGMSLCIGSILLQNTDSRFTPNKNATVGTAILPNRPLKFNLGFYVNGTTQKLISIFKGLTFQPKENKMDSSCAIDAYDYMRFINDYALESTMYIDQRSDEIITDILTTVGFAATQYVLDEGLNTIGYAWFEKGDTAGERIRKICEAEEATFYQDEDGILRFENRRHFSVSPHNISVWDFDPDDIISWEQDDSTPIINSVIVKSKPRHVEGVQEIWRDGIEEVLTGGESKDIWINFENPITSMETPVEDVDYSAYTLTDGGGSNVSANITVTVTLFTTTAKITIENTATTTAYVNLLRLRGAPALITSEVNQLFEDTDSISKYSRQQLVIENDFIDDEDFAKYYSSTLVRKYKNPLRRIKIVVQGVPQIQLRDKVRVYDIDTSAYKNYRVMQIKGLLAEGLFTQELTLREITIGEADSFAIVGIATIDNIYEIVGT